MSEIAVIIIGASDFPHYPGLGGSSNLLHSAKAFHDWALASLCNQERMLWLFNDDGLPAEQDIEIADFLDRCSTALDVIIYYVGHGAFLRDQTFYLVCKRTQREHEWTTAIRVSDLAETLRQHFRLGRSTIILDCCFAASAVSEFLAVDQAAMLAQNHLATRGTCLLVAASKGKAAIAPGGETFTMFSGALLEALQTNTQTTLSARALAERVQTIIKDKYGSSGVRPEIHSPRQVDGDISDRPLFPPFGAPSVRRITLADRLRTRILRLRRILYRVPHLWQRVSLALAILAIMTAAAAAALRQYQEGRVQQLAVGFPVSQCQAKGQGSPVQIFENGWLVEDTGDGRIVAIEQQSDGGVRWSTHYSRYKSGAPVDCAHLPGEGYLRRGFRYLLCVDEPSVSAALGKPLASEARVLIQYQQWTGGILIYGLPRTQLGFPLEDGCNGPEHFSSLAAAFLERTSPSQNRGNGRWTHWSEGQGPTASYCSASWWCLDQNRKASGMVTFAVTGCPLGTVDEDDLGGGSARCFSTVHDKPVF